MRQLKHLVGALLCLVLFAGSFSIKVQASESGEATDIQSGTCGDKVVWQLVGDTLTISGSGEMCDYGIYDAPWSEYRENIKKIVIQDGVTAIGNAAFFECKNLIEVEASESIKNIGEDAFFLCSDLTDDSLHNLLKGGAHIEESAFRYCSSLTNIVIPASVTMEESVFEGCYNAKTIVVDAANEYYCAEENVLFDKSKSTLLWCAPTKEGSYTIPDSVTGIGNGAFVYCKKITEFNIPLGVLTIGENAFYACDGITEIVLPSSVTTIQASAFENCRNLTKVVIPPKITSISDGTFAYTALTEIETSANIKSIGVGAFAYCDGITNDTLQKLLRNVEHIGENAFSNCTGITSIMIPTTTTSIEKDAFSNCYGVKTIFVDEANEYYSAEDNVLYDKAKSTLLMCAPAREGSCDIPDSVTRIEDDAFSMCKYLTEINIPSGVTYIGEWTFYHCENLTKVVIPPNITSIPYYAFAYSGLTEIEIPKGVTTIDDYAFYSTAITEVTIPKEVTTIGEMALGYVYDSSSGKTVVPENYIIRGYANSAAEEYAKSNNITFIALADEGDIVTIGGAVTSYGDGSDQVLISVQGTEGTIEATTNESSGSYQLKAVSAGTYTISVSKEHHVPRTYTVTVDDANVTQDMEIYLIGDVTGDGSINARDKKLVYNHIAGTSVLTDYIFAVGDVTGDGVINAKDKKLIYNHIAGTSSLWK